MWTAEKTCRRTLFELPHFPSLTKIIDSGDGAKTHSESRILGYTCEQMFDVVSDVGSYQNFVPWCQESKVVDRGEGWLRAQVTMQATPAISVTCNSQVNFLKPNLVLAVGTDAKVVEQIKSEWRFDPVPGHPGLCHVDVAVALTLRSVALSRLVDIFYDEIALKNVDAFLGEAVRRYGKEAHVPEVAMSAFRNSRASKNG